MRTFYFLKQFTEANILPEDKHFKSLKYLKNNKNDKPKFELVQQFVKDFKNSVALCGRNKPNRQYGPQVLWHYHIGYPNYNEYILQYKDKKNCCPTKSKIEFCSVCINFEEKQLGMQIAGMSSKAVLHYILCEDNSIILWAWGDEHEPFPDIDLPIFKKIKEWIRNPENLIAN